MGSSPPLQSCSGEAAEDRHKQVPTMVEAGHQKMPMWKRMTTGQEVEGCHRSTTKMTKQEGRLGQGQ